MNLLSILNTWDLWIAPLISNPLRTSQSNRSPLASNLTGEVIALEQAVRGEVARVNGSKAVLNVPT